jgi:hypothetical protein
MITYTPQAADFIAAAKLEMRLQFRKNWASNLLAIVLLGGLGLSAVLGVSDQGRTQGFAMFGIGIFVYALFALNYYVVKPADIRRSLRRRTPKQVRIEWDETHLISEDEVVKVTGPWSEFTRWLESEEVFILFFRGRRFQVIPKRVLADPAMMRSFHDILLRKIGAAGVIRK